MKTLNTPNGRIITYVELSSENQNLLDEVMKKSVELYNLCERTKGTLPTEIYFQLFGKGDCVIVREKEKNSDEHFFD